MSNVFSFRQPPHGFIAEFFGGGKTSTSSSSVSIPPEVLARYNAVNARAEKTAEQPFQEYGNEFVAPLSETQKAGINSTNTAAGQAQPYYDAATGLTMSGARDVGPLTQGQIGYYQNPYNQAVVDTTTKALQQQFGLQNANQQSQAIKAGAYGGGGDSRARALLSGQQDLAFGQTIAPLYKQGYTEAADLAKSQQGVVAADLARRMQAGTQIANLGTGAQTAGLQGAAAQLAAGQTEQQTKQAEDTAKYQQFLQKQRYPFDVTQFLANIAEGTGALSGSTTTTTSPRGLFGNRGGAMTGERHAKYAGGGLVPEGFDESSMGGAVMPDMEGMGFARGGYAEGGMGPYGNMSILNAGTGIVPPPMQNNYKLMVSNAKIPEASGGLGDALKRGEQAVGMYKFGKQGLIGTPKTASDPEGSAGLIGGQGSFSGENAFSKLKDFLTPKAAHGGLILEREHHAGGDGNVVGDDGDSTPDDKETSNKAGVPGSFLTPGFLQSGAQHPKLQTSGGGGGGGGGGGSFLGDAAKGIGMAKTAFDLGTALFALSDARAKDNIRPVGETYDGQNIYSYNIGEGPTQMGLMAQEVMERKPEAVGRRGEYLTVDYDRATEDASPFAYGGLVPREHHDGSEGNVAGGDIRDIITQNANDQGVDPNLAMKIAGGESRFKSNAQAGTSTAGGLFQIIDSTYSGLGGAPGKKYDPNENARVGTRYIAQNQEALRNAGFEPTHGNTYLAHFLGAGGANAALINPDKPLSETLSNYGAAAKSNPFIKNWTGNDVINWANAKMEGKGFNAPPRPPKDVGPSESKSGLIPDMGGLVDKVSSPSFAVPALGFLGSLLSSKSRTLAGALGEGMLGGVGAYQSNKKQEMETAKNLVEMIGNRFERQLVNGQVVYRNKLTGSETPASQMANYTYEAFKNAGLDPKTYGIAPPSAPTAPGLAPAVASAPAGSASGAAPAAAPGAPAAPGEKPPAEGAKPPAIPTNPSDMSATQLRAYYEKNPEAAGLVGDDDPRVIRAKIKTLKDRAEDFRSKLNDNAGATEADRQAQVEQARLDGLLSAATEHQSKVNQKLNEQQATQSGKFEEEILKRQELYKRARGNWERLGDIYSELSTGRAETFKADLASWADGFGIPLPNLQQKLANAANVDAATKITMQEVYDAMARENLVRAPAASAKGLSQTVPGPGLTPGAVYEIVGKNLGELEHVKRRDDTYLDQARGTVPAKFLRDYDAKNPSSLKEDVARGLNMLTINPNVPRETIDSLYKTYGAHGYDPRGTQAGSAAPAAAPAAQQPAPVTIKNDQEYNALPRNTLYTAPDGSIRRKQ